MLEYVLKIYNDLIYERMGEFLSAISIVHNPRTKSDNKRDFLNNPKSIKTPMKAWVIIKLVHTQRYPDKLKTQFCVWVKNV